MGDPAPTLVRRLVIQSPKIEPWPFLGGGCAGAPDPKTYVPWVVVIFSGSMQPEQEPKGIYSSQRRM